MSDTIDSLNRIADILQSSSEPGFLQTMGGQFLILFAGAALGAFVTYLMSKKLQQELFKQNKAEEEAKRTKGRQLLSALLEDEIKLRWEKEIGKYFKKHFKELNEENLRKISNTTFKMQDLFIIQQCAKDVFAANLFNDNALVSYIVHVHVLSRDLVDGKEGLRKRFKEYQRAVNALESAGNDDKADKKSLERKRDEAKERLDRIWEFLKGAYYGIDKDMKRILNRIKRDC